MSSSFLEDCTSPDLLDLSDFAHVWRAGELDGTALQTVATGHSQLDSALPGHGWPQGALIEILQPQAGLHEWGLLAPALNAVQGRASDKGDKGARSFETGARMLTLINPPHLPFGPALGAQHLHMPRMLCINSGDAPALLWATREALQCADVTAVLAWLPDSRSAHLRRLQIAAHAHNKLLFVFRPPRAQHESSPAPLRLLLEGVVSDEGNLLVHVLKRRGPPLAAPILLDTWPARLAALLAASRERARLQREEAEKAALPLNPFSPFNPSNPVDPVALPQSSVHDLLDRLAHLDPH
jgi:protein ImuA